MTKILLPLSAVAMLAAASTIASAGQFGGGFAAVGLDGSLKQGMNVKDLRHISAGKYLVRFNHDVSQCSLKATVTGRNKESLLPAYIVTGTRHSNAVVVETFLASTLLPGDFPFDLTATCGA